MDSADTPFQAGRLDHRLAFGDLFGRPGRAVGDLVQRRYNAAGAGLPHMLQGDGVRFTEPAPGFLHILLLRKMPFDGAERAVLDDVAIGRPKRRYECLIRLPFRPEDATEC